MRDWLRENAFRAVPRSDFSAAHRSRNVVGLPDGERHDGQGRVFRGAGRKLASIGDKEVLDVVRLATPLDRVVPLRGMRGMIADKMRRSLSETAQLTHHAECGAGAIVVRKALLAQSGIKVSVEDLILDRVVATLLNHPDLNGTLKEREVLLSGAIHLSVAMALPGNLLVAPAIFNCETLTLEARAAARKDLAERARNNKLTVPEMTGGTFSVSNLGLSRVKYFTPILNTPQIAILGIGRIDETAFPDGKGGIEFRPVMGLSLTFDHQAVDGAPAAAFLSDLCVAIEAAA